MRNYILILLVFLVGTLNISAQELLKTPVVVVRSMDKNNYEKTGTGILVGRENNTIYILTAGHVLLNPQNLSIQLFTSNQRIAAKVVQYIDRWDLAVLSFTIPGGYQIPNSFAFATGTPTFRESVTVIGHPVGDYWDINISNAVKALEYEVDDRLFTISSQGIREGHSGGPVLNAQNQLLGLIQKTDSRKTVCVSVPVIQKVLHEARAPDNLLSGVENVFDPQSIINNIVQITVTNNNVEQSGTGTIVGEIEDAFFIITNLHVIEDLASEISVSFNGYEKNPGSIIKLNEELGLALIKTLKPFNYEWNKKCLAKSFNEHQRGTYYMLQEKSFYTSKRRDQGLSLNSENGNIKFEFMKGIPGSSGAPILTKNGVIGIVISTGPKYLYALSMAKIKEFVTDYGRYEKYFSLK